MHYTSLAMERGKLKRKCVYAFCYYLFSFRPSQKQRVSAESIREISRSERLDVNALCYVPEHICCEDRMIVMLKEPSFPCTLSRSPSQMCLGFYMGF